MNWIANHVCLLMGWSVLRDICGTPHYQRIELAAITSEVIKGTFAENRPFEDLAKRPRNVNRM